MKATIHIAGTSIEVEAESQVKLVEKMGFWGEVPTTCGNCNSANIGFFSRTPQGNLYVGVKCRDCKHELNFGQNKEGGRLFIKHDQGWQAPFSKGDSGNSGGGGYHDPQNQGPVEDDSDIPF